jgi:branched-chain amino acid transport system ATP-binding protein
MLEISGLNSGYNGVPILRDVTLSARRGAITLVVGENGAGKTTLLRTIAGFIAPTAGAIRFDGVDLAGRKPEEIVARGARLVLDGHRVFPDISVWDNIRLGATARHDRASFARAAEEVFSLFPVLKERRRQLASSLSGGQQQMLALAQALVGEPQLLMCDEPSFGLAQALMPPILKALKNCAARDVAVVVVEQYVDLVLPYASQVIVLERGRLIRICDAQEFACPTRSRAPADVETMKNTGDGHA